MKKNKIIACLFLFSFFFTSCEDSMKGCVQGMMDDGYSYDEAWDLCDEAAYDSQIR